MGAVVFVVLIAIGFLIFSMLFLKGKGSFLISGYNTMTKEQKAQYDEKKLCRGTGVVCVVVAVMLIIMTYLSYQVEIGIMKEGDLLPFVMIFIGVVLVAIGANIYYTNKNVKKKVREKQMRNRSSK